MTWNAARWRAVRALRRDAQATALRELASAETAVRRLEGQLDAAKARVARLARERCVPADGELIPAGQLAAGSRAHHAAGERQERLALAQAAIRDRLVEARDREARARRALREATVALQRLDDIEPG